MRHRWISPQFITTNRIDDSSFYAEVREMGARVIEALGIGTSATHMEWFHGPKGLRFSEIGCRPPGVGAWDLYSAANDADVYREWAHAIVHGSVAGPLSRAYSAGIVALRPEPGRPDPGLLRSSTRSSSGTVPGSSTRTCRTRAAAPSPWRRATWPTPGSG